jgi:hypothetical protein
MPSIKVPLAEATPTQLATYATEVLGLPGIAAQLGRDRIIAAMRAAAYTFDYVQVDAEDPNRAAPIAAARTAGGKASALAQLDGDAKERLMIVELTPQDGTGGQRPQFVGVNGIGILIPRGEPVVVKERYVNALNSAKKREPIKNSNMEIIGWREVHLYPFSVLGEAPKDHAAKALQEQAG